MDKTAVTKEAQKYIAKGEIDKAVAELQKIIKEEQDANVYNAIGDLHLRNKEKEKAIEEFKKAANIFKEDGFYLKAIALYKKILNIHPSDTATLILLGELNAERGLTGNANENFSAAINIFTKEGAEGKALDVYKKMLKFFPSDINLRIKVAEIFLKAGITEEAVKEFVNVAVYHLNRDEFNEARQFYLKAIELDPKFIGAFLGLSKIAEIQNDNQQATEYLKNAMSVQPSNSEVLLNYSRLAIKAGNADEGKQALMRLIETDPSNNEYKKLLGNIYLKEGLTAEAWEQLSPYIDETIRLGNWDEAIRRLSNFVDFKPMDVKTMLITAYRGKADVESAVKELRELAALYENSKMPDQAILSYREILKLMPSDEAAEVKIIELGNEVVTSPEMQSRQKPSAEVEALLKTAPPVISPEDLLEDGLAEADLHLQQGLKQEAMKIYEKLLTRFPDNEEIIRRIEELSPPSKDKSKPKKHRVSYI
ncbi:MAG: tetratricopeptide repeat protein [Nitrospirae bacterium]|nr:tetratricopeptide repeat protein [Nitrospirota bacterium]